MKLLYSAIELVTVAPVQRLILGINRVNIIVINYLVYGEEILNITDIKIIITAGL